jgi:hypothetical protein
VSQGKRQERRLTASCRTDCCWQTLRPARLAEDASVEQRQEMRAGEKKERDGTAYAARGDCAAEAHARGQSVAAFAMIATRKQVPNLRPQLQVWRALRQRFNNDSTWAAEARWWQKEGERFGG